MPPSGRLGLPVNVKGQFVETRTQAKGRDWVDSAFRRWLSALEVPKTTTSFPAASCAMIAVQIRYALGHGDVIGQAIQPGEWEKL